ncbi:MAG: AAA family ATPase [Campylobacterota bacterium]|nr:AAA family ATPase [Campylobacterota bacterium]
MLAVERIHIKNFGPLKEIDIELNQINIFIGKNGSGKSVLAKIITIFLDVKNHIVSEDKLFQKFKDYNIFFFNKDSTIKFYVGNSVILELKENKIHSIGYFDDVLVQDMLKESQLNIINSQKLTSQYIPAERNLISLFTNSLSSFVVSQIPLPKFLLHFSSEFEKAREEIKELDFFDMKYINKGKDLIYFNKDEYLDLEHSSSGVQSSLPLYLTVKYFSNKHKSIIIEEPEQNLFPKAQSDTIKYIVEQVSADNKLFMMTHSPYVLSTLNILLYAHRVAKLNNEANTKVSEIIPKDMWIDSNNFSAYYLENGIARNIKSSRGLISDNEIDDISEDIAGEFDELLDIYRTQK